MLDALQAIKQELEEATRDLGVEVHYLKNLKQRVTYPYLAFTYYTQQLQPYSDDYIIQIHLYDKGASVERIEKITSAIRRHFDREGFRLKESGLLMLFQSLVVESSPSMESADHHKRYMQLITRIYY